MSVPTESKQVAKLIREAFCGEGRPAVIKYWDDSRKNSIGVVIASDSPDEGYTSYSTVGLWEYSIDRIVDGISLRVELAGACISGFESFPNMISTCAFNIINSGYTIFPGAIYPDVVKMYMPDSQMQHAFFVSPFLWGGELKTIRFEECSVTWLQMIPISDEEMAYAEENGALALEDLFEQKGIDFWDLNRSSVL